jgi:hypothetical protein
VSSDRISQPRLAAPPDVRLPFDLVRVHGDLAHVSGHGPFDGDRLLITAASEPRLPFEQAYDAARVTGLSILATLKRDLRDLDRVTGWVKAPGSVDCAEGFTRADTAA